MKVFVLFLVVIFFFVGCKNEKKGNIKYDFKTIKVSFSTTKEAVLSTDIIDSIQYIKLEDTKEPIGEIKKILVDDNKIIIWDNSRKNIWVFSDKGKFIGRIAKLGREPEEYASIINFSFTAPNKIHIIDGWSQAIKTYSTTGEFISKEETEGIPCDYLDCKNLKYYYIYTNENNLGHRYRLNIKDSANTTTVFFDYTKPSLFAGLGGDFILKSKNKLYLRQPYNDTIFCLNNKELIARYVFDFGKNSYPSKDIYLAKDMATFKKIISKKAYEGNISDVIISKKYIVLKYYQQIKNDETKTSILIYNTQTNQISTYHYLLKGAAETMVTYPMATDGEYFYYPCNSADLPEQVIKRYKEQGRHSNYDENSNPTIIRYKYKL